MKRKIMILAAFSLLFTLCVCYMSPDGETATGQLLYSHAAHAKHDWY